MITYTNLYFQKPCSIHFLYINPDFIKSLKCTNKITENKCPKKINKTSFKSMIHIQQGGNCMYTAQGSKVYLKDVQRKGQPAFKINEYALFMIA